MTVETFGEWLEVGYANGWVAQGVCQTHDGAPLTPEEEDEFEQGYDPCVPILRVWYPDGPPTLPDPGGPGP